MEFDLRAHLRDLSAAPTVHPEAVPTDVVLARVRRGRALRATSVAVASAAAVLAVGAVVYASPWQSTPPAQTPRPTATEPAPTTSPEPTPDLSPTPPPEPSVPSPYALTSAGDLVELDPQTGAVVRTVASDPAWTWSLSVTADRRFAYVDAASTSDEYPARPGEIQRVSLVDGTVETVVTSASTSSISPDGASLAYLAVTPDEEYPDSSFDATLTVMDVATGAVTATITDVQGCYFCERAVGTPAWTQDGRLVLGLGWTDTLSAQYLVDPATTSDLADATLIGPDASGELDSQWGGKAAFSPDGTMLVTAQEGTSDQWLAWFGLSDDPDPELPTSTVLRVDPTTGSVVDRIPVDGIPVDGIPTDVAAAPVGEAALVVVVADGDLPGVLHRWDGTALTPAGEGYVSVAW